MTETPPPCLRCGCPWDSCLVHGEFCCDGCFHFPELKTPDEWCQIKGLRVMDPDGWRGQHASHWSNAITEAEFDERAAMSTVRRVP